MRRAASAHRLNLTTSLSLPCSASTVNARTAALLLRRRQLTLLKHFSCSENEIPRWKKSVQNFISAACSFLRYSGIRQNWNPRTIEFSHLLFGCDLASIHICWCCHKPRMYPCRLWTSPTTRICTEKQTSTDVTSANNSQYIETLQRKLLYSTNSHGQRYPRLAACALSHQPDCNNDLHFIQLLSKMRHAGRIRKLGWKFRQASRSTHTYKPMYPLFHQV